MEKKEWLKKQTWKTVKIKAYKQKETPVAADNLEVKMKEDCGDQETRKAQSTLEQLWRGSCKTAGHQLRKCNKKALPPTNTSPFYMALKFGLQSKTGMRHLYYSEIWNSLTKLLISFWQQSAQSTDNLLLQ